jgi:hypothetical protein
VLITNGTNTVAVGHVQDTPLTFGYPGTDWEGLSGTLGRSSASVPIQSLSFYQLDPRIVFLPLTAEQVRALGFKVYRTSSDPYKFQDAVVVGAREDYCGECRFQLDLSTPLYLKMDHNSLKGLFGKFNPSSGDLVFSRTGELLGVMANSTYCVMIRNFDPTATLQFAPDVRNQETGATLARLFGLIARLPHKLQRLSLVCPRTGTPASGFAAPAPALASGVNAVCQAAHQVRRDDKFADAQHAAGGAVAHTRAPK